MIKAGEVAVLKSSQEEVFVLRMIETPGEFDPKGSVLVRRPTMSTEGIKHLVEEYALFELETPDERRSRNFTEQLELQQRFSSFKQADGGSQLAS